MNLVGALRKAMSTTGYTEIKEFQRVEVVVGGLDHRSAAALRLTAVEDEAAAELRRLRDSIDNMDAALVHLLAERFKITQQVGDLKARHGLPPADPSARLSRLPGCVPSPPRRSWIPSSRRSSSPSWSRKWCAITKPRSRTHQPLDPKQDARSGRAPPRATKGARAPGRPVRPLNRQPPRKVPSRAR